MPTQPVRPLRADAQRNRDAILAAAHEVFDRDGIFAPLDTIATAAGVGNATLYRNFPTRDDLLAAVMQDSVRALLDESATLQSTLGAEAALREWNYRLAWQLRLWQDLPSCIATAIDDAASPVQIVVQSLVARTGELLGAVDTVTPQALFELITAISWGIDRFGDDEEQARARVTLATAGVFAPA